MLQLHEGFQGGVQGVLLVRECNPWSVSNNQGEEGMNKEIKQSQTFRRRLDMGEMLFFRNMDSITDI